MSSAIFMNACPPRILQAHAQAQTSTQTKALRKQREFHRVPQSPNRGSAQRVRTSLGRGHNQSAHILIQASPRLQLLVQWHTCALAVVQVV